MTGYAVGTSRKALPWFARFGVEDYSPIVFRVGKTGYPERVIMNVALQHGPYGRVARWWLSRRGWSVETLGDEGPRIVVADCRFVR